MRQVMPCCLSNAWKSSLRYWLLLFASSCMLDHCDLFGLRQVWLYVNRRPCAKPGFVSRDAYNFVRHPFLIGLLLGGRVRVRGFPNSCRTCVLVIYTR